MYSNILIATDLSRDSDEMVRCATGLHALGCRKAHLVYGLDVEEIGAVRDGLEQLVHAELDKQCSALQAAGIEAAGHIALYPVSREIELIAAQNGCTLIVAGSRVHSLAGEIFAGGIAATVLTSTRRPLLMLRLHQADTGAPPACGCWPCAPLEHLLFPTDFSENAVHVFDYIERFVKEYAPGRITLMHVQDRKRIEPHLANRLEEFNVKDHKRLTELHHRLVLAAPTSHLSMEMPFGHPAQEILDYCRSESVSLVVMGTQGRGYVNEMFLGSVSHNVTRQATSPILLIPK